MIVYEVAFIAKDTGEYCGSHGDKFKDLNDARRAANNHAHVRNGGDYELRSKEVTEDKLYHMYGV